jgi:drug/metabolite transporter (DMT)-like permease
LKNSSPNRHPLRGYLFIASAALCWGISATLGRAAFTGRIFASGGVLPPIDPLILAQSRVTISLLVLGPALLAIRGRRGMRMPQRDFWWAMLLGVVGIAASNYFYYLAILKTNVATAIILQYTAPVWVLLYMVARRLQRPTLQRVISVGLALVGIALVIDLFNGGGLRLNRTGVMAAMLASLSFACYNIFGGALVQKYDRWKALAYVLMGTVTFWLVVNPPWKVVAAHYSGRQWEFLGIFAVTSVLLPFSLYFSGLHHLDPTRAIVTSCLEPVFSIAITAIALGELVGKTQVVGMVLVLAATLMAQIGSTKDEVRGTK